MIVSFCVRKASTLAESAFSLAIELLLLLLEPLRLLVERLQLLLQAGLPLQRLPRQVLAAGGQRLPRLRVELDDALLELRLLQLEALLGRDHVGDPALDVLQQLELLLVRVVQRLAGSSARSSSFENFAFTTSDARDIRPAIRPPRGAERLA